MAKIRFGADGIRGIFGEWPLRPQDIVRIGDALGRYVRLKSEKPVAVIGRDTRPSGETIFTCLKEQLRRHGVHVTDIGIMTTPGTAYLVRRDEDADLGIIVTASHNPAQYNGIKLLDQQGLRLQSDDEIQIEQMILDSAQQESRGVGQVTEATQLANLYIQNHVSRCPVASLHGQKITIDCANGAATVVAPQVFQGLEAQVSVIHDDPGNELINEACGSEDVRRNPERLVNLVRQNGSAYGLAFDGDGDRLIIVDAEGHFYNGDDLLFALATYFKEQGKLHDNTIVTTNIANSGLKEALQRSGIRTVETQNGDKYLEARMWSSGYLLGGEQVGNIIINDGYHTAADPLYAAVILFGILQDQKTTLRQLVKPLQKRPQALATIQLFQRQANLESSRQFRQHMKNSKDVLGTSSRILSWSSSTEVGHFKIMVEGTLANTYDEVRLGASRLCRLAQQMTNTISSEPTIMRLG